MTTRDDLEFADLMGVPEEYSYPRPLTVPDGLLETFASRGMRKTAQDAVMSKVSLTLLKSDVRKSARPLPTEILTKELAGRQDRQRPTSAAASSLTGTQRRTPAGRSSSPSKGKGGARVWSGKYNVTVNGTAATQTLHTRHMSPAVETSVFGKRLKAAIVCASPIVAAPLHEAAPSTPPKKEPEVDVLAGFKLEKWNDRATKTSSECVTCELIMIPLWEPSCR